tara:strand:+ start:666 stop:806 length:141 start_codon:yes stop_codon:yes gene_type:complete
MKDSEVLDVISQLEVEQQEKLLCILELLIGLPKDARLNWLSDTQVT